MRVRGGAEKRALASEYTRKTEFPEDDRGASPNKEGLVLSPTHMLPRHERKIS